ncbi:hypothetical protein IPZ58_07795 [Streptomyces roseoverticillatus]|uniref:hypothetical protein n=1 Tax=Streptomyces roseoverticillatus TaxID=66429 RepID=UPI001F440743|nr:hypothetical protein [Streptomyces roseoverticillatus]MCF3101481.1 hypothetical protein [Streptomyces roseoverticillatus]
MLNALDWRVILLTCIGVTALIAAGAIALVLIARGVWNLAGLVLALLAAPRGQHRAPRTGPAEEQVEGGAAFLAGLYLPAPCPAHGPHALHVVHADSTRTCARCDALAGEAQ